MPATSPPDRHARAWRVGRRARTRLCRGHPRLQSRAAPKTPF